MLIYTTLFADHEIYIRKDIMCAYITSIILNEPMIKGILYILKTHSNKIPEERWSPENVKRHCKDIPELYTIM